MNQILTTAPESAAVTYNLNEGQEEAAEAFFEFLMSPAKEFCISGAAGVGKTYLMRYIIDATMPRYEAACIARGERPRYSEIVMTATTNKAAEVLSQSTGRPTSTIHSFLNLIVTEDWDTGRMKLRRNRNWKVHLNTIIFVDECSMIDEGLYRALHDATVNCKLVFVGDHNQLAPVLETLSMVYQQESPLRELTQPMRNSGQPALMALCQQFRDTVETGIFRRIDEVPGVIDRLDGPAMQDAIDEAFAEQNLDSRILAFSNKRVIEYNDHIRDLRGLPDSFVAGEYLVNNSATQISKAGKTVSLPAEHVVRILRNHGPAKRLVTKDVELDVDVLDIDAGMLGMFHGVPVPTNRDHHTALVKYYGKQKSWAPYFALQNDYLDLRPRDAATVHKSQGSTYDTVFIDLANIGKCNVSDMVARMLYVAISRAKNRVLLYGKLPAKYGG